METIKKGAKMRSALSEIILTSAFVAPIKGIQYFYHRTEYWPPLLVMCIPATFISIVVFMILATVVFPMNAALMTSLFGPFGFISAVISLFSLSSQITVWIVQVLFLRHVSFRVYEQVFRAEKLADVVARYELTKSRLGPKKTIQGRLINQTLPWLGREILYTLLRIIPIIGPLFVLVLQSPIKGCKSNRPYYKLMMWDYAQINRYYHEYYRDLFAFGFVALILEMVPFISVFFMFTSNIGIALWTSRFHKDFDDFMKETEPDEAESADETEFWNIALDTKKEGKIEDPQTTANEGKTVEKIKNV